MPDIRRANEADWAVVEKIYNECKLDELSAEAARFELLPLKEDVPRLTKLKSSNIYLYRDRNSTVGLIALDDHRINYLFVRKRARRMGVGRALLKYVLEIGCKRGSEPYRLNVVKSNAVAIDLYQQFGFVVTKEFEAEYNGQRALAISMIRLHDDA